MWTRQFQDMWADYLNTKKRERSIQYARQCIKKPTSFLVVSFAALLIGSRLSFKSSFAHYNVKEDVGVNCDLKVYDIDTLCANLAVYFTDKFENCQNVGASRVGRLNKRCDRMKRSIGRIMAQRSRVLDARDEKTKN